MEESRPDKRASFWNPKRLVLGEVLVFSVGMMIVMTAFVRYPMIAKILELITIFGWGVGMLAWIKVDSRMRDYPLHPRQPLAVAIFGTLALVYYLFRSRGLVGGLTGVGYFLLFAFTMLTVSLIAGVIVMVLMIVVLGPGVLEN